MEANLNYVLRSFLLRLSYDITEEKLEQIKYLCSDDIPERDLEIIDSPLRLFKDLERRQMIGIDNLTFLRELLTDAMCPLLVTKVDDFELRREVELLCLKKQRQQKLKQEGQKISKFNFAPNQPDRRAINCGKCSQFEGDRGREPGRIGGGRGMGCGRRKGGKRDSQSGRNQEKRRKMSQYCVTFHNRNRTKR